MMLGHLNNALKLSVVILLIGSCSSPEKNRIKQQIVQLDEQYITKKDELLQSMKDAVWKTLKNQSTEKLEFQFDKAKVQRDSLKQVCDSLRVLLGFPILQGLNWLSYERVNGKIDKMQHDEFSRRYLFVVVPHTRDEFIQFVLDIKYYDIFVKLKEERQGCLKSLKLISLLEQ